MELAPGDAHALRSAASLARILGRRDEAQQLIGKALALDPLDARTHRQAAMIYLMSRDLERTAAAFQLSLDLGPNGGLTRAFLAVTRVLQGRADEALPLAQAEPHDVFRHVSLTMTLRALGRHAEADAELQALADRFGWTAAFQVAECYADRRDIDRAFEWLEKAYLQRDPGVVYAAEDPFLEPLHGDPRWPPFLHKLGLAK